MSVAAGHDLNLDVLDDECAHRLGPTGRPLRRLTDPRSGEVTSPLLNVAVIALCAVICGADDLVAITRWGRTTRDWLAQFLDLSAGIPSHDRFNAIVALLKPAEFEQCLVSWLT